MTNRIVSDPPLARFLFSDTRANDSCYRCSAPHGALLATSDVRALVLPGPFFNELVRDAPSVGATIRGAVRARRPRM